MYRSVAVVVLLAVVGSHGQDRTISTVTSGLTNLLSAASGAGAPYPPAPESYHPTPEYHAAPEYHGAHSAPYPAAAPESYHSEPYTTFDHQDHGFTVQSGYEGLIFPTGPAPEKSAALPILGGLGGIAVVGHLLHKLLPFPLNKIALFIGTKLGLEIIGVLLLVLVGGAATTALCAFTPICTIKFLGFPFLSKESTRSLLSQERLDSATQFVYDAIDKYKKLNARLGKAVNKIKSKKAKEQKEEREAKEQELKENSFAKEGRALKSSEPSTEAKKEDETPKTEDKTPKKEDETPKEEDKTPKKEDKTPKKDA